MAYPRTCVPAYPPTLRTCPTYLRVNTHVAAYNLTTTAHRPPPTAPLFSPTVTVEDLRKLDDERAPRDFYFGVAGILFAGSLLVFAVSARHRINYRTTNGEGHNGPTELLINNVYNYMGFYGLSQFFEGSVKTVVHLRDTSRLTNYYEGVMLGMAFLTPPVTLAIVGRQAIFGFMVRRFDRDANKQKEAGAFMAEVLESSADISLER